MPWLEGIPFLGSAAWLPAVPLVSSGFLPCSCGLQQHLWDTGTASHGFCSSCGQAVAASHGPEWRGSQLPSCSRPLMGTAPAGLFPWVFGPPHPLGFLLWPRVLWVLWLTLSPPVSSSILWEGLVLAAPCRPLGNQGSQFPQ